MAAEVATPDAFVTAVFRPPAKVTLAPLEAGAVKVTVMFGTGFPPASVTVATSGFVNALLIFALCPPPLVATIFAAGPTVFVRANKAVVAAPDEAITLYPPA